MKYIKTFEDYDFGRFNNEEEITKSDIENLGVEEIDDIEGEDNPCETCADCNCIDCECDDYDGEDDDEGEEDRVRRWGDEEIVE